MLHFDQQAVTPLAHPTFALKPNHQINRGMAGKITQVILPDQDEYNFQLLMPLLAQLSLDNRWFAWIAPPLKMPKSWMLHAGIDPHKIMLLQPRGNLNTLDLAIKALESGNSHAVISWPGGLSMHELDRLEAAARVGKSHAILLRPR